MVSERRKHPDEPVTSIGQGKYAELVEDLGDVGDGREQPAEIVLIDTLRVEGGDSKEPSGFNTKSFEQRGGE